MTRIYGALEVMGGTLSLGFIVAIGIVILILAPIYLGAAFVVLGRFAGAARRRNLIAFTVALVCAVFALLWLHFFEPEVELLSGSELFRAWIAELLWIAPISVGSVWLYLLSRNMSGLLRFLGLGLLPAAIGAGMALLPQQRWDITPESAAGLGLLLSVLLGLIPLALAGLIEMRRGVEWFIATRYLVAERRQIFISAITLICVGAVAAGVWLIITVLSVMNGFEKTWREEIVGNYAHLIVRSYSGEIIDYPGVLERIEALEGVVAANPFLDGEGMIRGGPGRLAPIRLRGIDPERAARVTRLDDKLVQGTLAELWPAGKEDGAPASGLIIGSVLADKLELTLGDPITLISPVGGAPTPMGPSPRLLRSRVVGLFQSSFLQFDELYAYATIPEVQEFLGNREGVKGFEVRTLDFYRSRRVAAAIEEELGHPFYARDWKELFPGFFHALQDNRSLMFMLLIMIMVVSAFVIVVTLMMMIMAKSTDVAILKTMGARDESIGLIFSIEGTLIGLAGVVLGVLAGVAVSNRLAWIQTQIEEITGVDTLPASVYQISTLPSELDVVQVFGVVAIALVLSLGATLLPSRHGARLDPVEVLREE